MKCYYSTPYGWSVPKDAVNTSLQAWLWHPRQRHFLHRLPTGASSGRGEQWRWNTIKNLITSQASVIFKLIAEFDRSQVFTVCLSFRPTGEIFNVPASLMALKIPPGVGMLWILRYLYDWESDVMRNEKWLLRTNPVGVFEPVCQKNWLGS